MNCALTVSEIAKEEERIRRARELVKEWCECDMWLMKVATIPRREPNVSCYRVNSMADPQDSVRLQRRNGR